MAFLWRIEPYSEGIRFSCLKGGFFGAPRVVPLSDWEYVRSKLPGAGLLEFLLQAEDARRDGDTILVPHAIVAFLSESQAASVDLPPAIPHALAVRSHGTIDEPGFNIAIEWMRYGTSPVRLRVNGAIATEGEHRYRIPGKLFELVGAIQAFQQADTSTRESRVIQWQAIQRALKCATNQSSAIRPDGYIEDLRIFHAASLSLSAEIDQERGITFDPVLFGRTILTKHKDDLFAGDPLADPLSDEDAGDDGSSLSGVDTLVDQSDALLPDELGEIFVKKRFDRDFACRQSYPLTRNTYVYIDPSLRKALDVVKKMQRRGTVERRAFIKNPRQAFADALGEEANSDAVRGVFVETRQYAEWINGIGIWQPKILPWLPTSPTTWLPEKIGFTIDGKNIEFPPDRLNDLRRACESALAEGESIFNFEGLTDLPATEETLAAIDILRDMAAEIVEKRSRTSLEDEKADAEKDHNKAGRYALEGDDNLESLCLKLGLHPRRADIDHKPPGLLKSNLHNYQTEGFNWLIKTWKTGRPGVLLADDMGLGKTIQTLAFAAWLHNNLDETGGGRGPFLIVAPTALLRNWSEEHDKHLSNGGIGPITEVYGSGIRAFKSDAGARKETVEGRGVLDRDRLLRTSCILTTYETLSNYHISFAGIRYPLVIFDEIQKLKTPTTINTHAAKTLNIDFVVGLTGTPVENSISDLWSIMDRLHPGLLKDLHSFTKTYGSSGRDALEQLRDKLRDGEQSGAAVMLRRMKDTTDIGRALPERKFVTLRREMPEAQAKAYGHAVMTANLNRLEEPAPGAMLKALQSIRGVSLHPEHPNTVIGCVDMYSYYVQQSARLIAAVDALDKIQQQREKSLVFIEYLDMQRTFADILRHRYQLPRMPSIINGQTVAARRQQLVAEFQRGPVGEFDVMILSPRAAGVGLNITAANHVIHLSRWWNPAIEDQCNDRVYRIGQDKSVTVYLPVASHPLYGEDSFDVKLDELLARKRKLSRDLLVPAVSESDLQYMFKSVASETQNTL